MSALLYKFVLTFAESIFYFCLLIVFTKGDLYRISTLAGKLTAGGVGTFIGADDGPGTMSSFNSPGGLAYSPLNKNIYIADRYNNCIRELTPFGVASKFQGRVEHIHLVKQMV